jgi:hypothetical protein
VTIPQEGDVIDGKYRVLSRLGIGGMAAVYLANVEGVAGFEKLVALKILHDHLSADGTTMELFLQEARLSALLQHANIGQIYDLGKTDDELFYIAMEYVRGRDLRALMNIVARNDALLPIPIILHICARVLEGLDYAHSLRDKAGKPLKLVHRDVSPSNCLISFTGEVKLIDFGIAKAANQAWKTRTGMVKGKANYFSPEQALGQPLDRRSDVFAMGVMLYELLVGERPFDKGNEIAVMTSTVAGRFRPPRELDPSLPVELEAIVLKALAHDRNDRYATAGELQEALEGYLMSIQVRVSAKEVAGFLAQMVGADIAVAGGAPAALLTAETGAGPRQTEVTRTRPRPGLSPRGEAPTVSREGPAQASPWDAATLLQPLAPQPAVFLLATDPMNATDVVAAMNTPRGPSPSPLTLGDPVLRPPPTALQFRVAPIPVPDLANLGPSTASAVRAGPRASRGPFVTAGLLLGLLGVLAAWIVMREPPPELVAGEEVPPPVRPDDAGPPAALSPAAPEVHAELMPAPTEPRFLGEPQSQLPALPPLPAVKVKIEKRPAVPRPTGLEAFVTVRSDRPSEVFVDGINIGNAPRVHYPVKPGHHLLRVDCLFDWGRQPGALEEVDAFADTDVKLNHACVQSRAGAP